MKTIYVRFGSKADIGESAIDVRFTPESGQWRSAADVCFVPFPDEMRPSKGPLIRSAHLQWERRRGYDEAAAITDVDPTAQPLAA